MLRNRFALIFAIMILTPLAVQAEEKDKALEIKETNSGNGAFALWLMPPRSREGTVTLTGHVNNMNLSKSFPFTFDMSVARQNLYKPYELLHGEKTGAGRWHYDWHYDWRLGVRGGRHNDQFLYSLPYQPGTSHSIAQGYGGTLSHQSGTESEYCIDFNMPVGTTVYAARGGQVIATRFDSNTGGPDLKQFAGAANYVVIKHDDATYASYQHLRQNGVLVQSGQMVKQGQPIAYSGLTGFTFGPHLHLQIYVPVDGTRVKSIPVKFRTATGVSSNLQKGQVYENPLN